MLGLVELDELLVAGSIDGECVAGGSHQADGGLADGAKGNQLDLLGHHGHLGGELVLRRLRQEGVVVVAGQDEIDAVGARLADLGDVGGIILGAGGGEHLADKVDVEALHLVLEHLDAVVPPGIVHAQGVEALELRLLDVERHRPRPHGPGGIGAEKVGNEALCGEASIAVVGRNEDRVPLGELGHDGECLGGQRNAGEETAIVALDHLLGFAHAGGGIADRVLDQQLDLASEDAALGVLQLGIELRAPLLLLTDGAQGAGERERHADLDDAAGLRLGAGPHIGRGYGCACAGKNGSTREAWLGGHRGSLPERAAFQHAAAGFRLPAPGA